MTAQTAIELAEEIEDAAIAGRLAPGQRLASVRAKAEELGISPTTVSAAYRMLRVRGVVVGKARQGTRIAPRVVRPNARPAAVPPGTIDAMTGNPDSGYLPSLVKALAAVDHDVAMGYGDSLVEPELASIARELFALDGVEATNLTVTSGAMDAIERVIAALGLRTGDRVGVEDPGHMPVHQLARNAGLELVPIAVDRHGITEESLAKALRHGISALIVTPRAQNPTGAALTIKRAEALTKVLAPHPEVALIYDDHAGPVAGTEFVAISPPGERWATIRSVAKSLGPDLRVALLVGDEQTINRVEIAINNGPGWVSHILQRTVAHLLSALDVTKLVAEAAASYSERREYLVSALAHQGILASGDSGFNVWIPVDNEQAAVEAARVAGFAVRAGDSYRLSSAPAIRVTIAGLEASQIDRLAEVLGEQRRPLRSSPQM